MAASSASSSSSKSDWESSSTTSGTDSILSSDEQNMPFEANDIQPWRFEPPGVEIEEREVIEQQPPIRLQNLDWCLCGNCQRMDREEECKCCLEFREIVNKNVEAQELENMKQPTCITDHPGFKVVCLNVWVLQAAWSQYRQQYGRNAFKGPQHKQNRHIAYRQLVRWCWGVIGRNIRIPLPACAVCCIRAHFPPPGLEDDFIFEGFHYADE